MSRPIHATVHTAALIHNLQRLRLAAGDAKLWAVVKANAYGHGLERVYEGLRGADGFALLDLNEAQRLRNLGWRGPILLLEGAFEPRDLELCSRLDLWHVVHCDEQIDWLSAHKTQVPHRVFLKVNSGMNRLGFAPHRVRSAWTRLNALPQVDEISLMTHFSEAEQAQGMTPQVACFVAATADLPGERSLSNSAAWLSVEGHPHAASLKNDWVRAGIALYGSSPDYPAHSSTDWGLQPAMTLSTKLLAVQTLQAGDRLGYGGVFTAPGPLRVGIAACGYADGYPRHAPTGTPVLVQGVRTRLLGRVSMDMVAVDLSPLEAAGLVLGSGFGFGSEVTLWGLAAKGAVLPIDEVAHAAGTVGYELMCGVASRVTFEQSADGSNPTKRR